MPCSAHTRLFYSFHFHRSANRWRSFTIPVARRWLVCCIINSYLKIVWTCCRYYTNHSTKYGLFVKYHAARVLVYVGLGDRVGSRVNLFSMTGLEPATANNKPTNQNEDDFICETCATPRNMATFSRSAMSVEGILLKVLQMVKQSQHLSAASATEPITEESPSANSPPAILPGETEQKQVCLMRYASFDNIQQELFEVELFRSSKGKRNNSVNWAVRSSCLSSNWKPISANLGLCWIPCFFFDYFSTNYRGIWVYRLVYAIIWFVNCRSCDKEESGCSGSNPQSQVDQRSSSAL